MIIEKAAASAMFLGIWACEPLTMQSDLSIAMAKQRLAIMNDRLSDANLHEEHFSWALKTMPS